MSSSNATETSPLLGGKSSAAERANDNDTTAQQQDEPSDSAPKVNEPSTWDLALTMGPCYIGSFLAALDSTIVATLSGPISDEFKSFTLLSWLASAYLISNAATQPLSGRLTDIYGRRNGLLVAYVLFAIGNLICGLARSEVVMLIGRVVAGMGGGCMNTISVFVG